MRSVKSVYSGVGGARGRSRLTIVAVMLVCILGGLAGVRNAAAQSVDVEQSLTEDRAVQRPLLSIHPWRWTRIKLLRTTKLIKDMTRLSLGTSYTTIYQIAPGAPTPHHTWVGSLDIYGAWHLVDSATLGDGTLGFVYRDRNVWSPLTGNQLAADAGLPWGINNSGSAAYNRFNQVWWQQSLLGEKLLIQAGKIRPNHPLQHQPGGLQRWPRLPDAVAGL